MFSYNFLELRRFNLDLNPQFSVTEIEYLRISRLTNRFTTQKFSNISKMFLCYIFIHCLILAIFMACSGETFDNGKKQNSPLVEASQPIVSAYSELL